MAVDEFSDYPDTGASGSQEYTSPQDPSIDFTSKNPRGDYDPPQPDADYGVGATGNVSTSARTSSGGGTGAPFIHPFKLQKFTNPEDNSTKVRVYEGDVYAKIDTFQLELVSLTTSVESYSTADPPAGPATKEQSLGSHSITFSDVTAQMPQHQHDVDGGAVFIPQHKHLARDSSEDGLVMPDHKHAAETSGDDAMQATAGSATADTQPAGDHSHGAGNYAIPDHTHKAQEGSNKLLIPQHKHLPRNGSEDGLVMPNHKHDAGDYVMPDHTHKAQEGSNKLLIPQHTHLPRNGSEDGLVMPNHQHDAGSYEMPDHQHTQGGSAKAKTGTDRTTGTTIQTDNTDHTHGVSGLTATVAEHSHSSQGTVSGTDQKLTIKQHTHLPRNDSEDGLVMPDHYHTSGGTGAGSSQQLKLQQHTHLPRNSSSDDGLVMPDHEHNAGDGSGNLSVASHSHTLNTGNINTSVVNDGYSSAHSGTCRDANHYHQVAINAATTSETPAVEGVTAGVVDHSSEEDKRRITGNTGNVKDFGVGNPATGEAPEDITGNTGGVDDYSASDGNNKKITGNTGNIVGFGGSGAPEEVQGNTGGIVGTPPSGSINGTLDTEGNHSHDYYKDDHSHDLDETTQTGNVHNKSSNDQITGTSSEVKDYSTNADKKRITGNTGNIDETSGTPLEVTGNTGNLNPLSSTAITGTSAEVKDYATDSAEKRITGNTGNITESSGTSLEVTGNTGGLSTSTSTAITGTSDEHTGHQHTYATNNHTHSVTGNTTQVTDYASNKKVTGETGSIKDYSTEANKKCTGTTGDVRVGSSATLPDFTISVSGSSSSSGLNHSHLVPALTSTPTTHKFVAVAGQTFQNNPPAFADFSNTFNKKIRFEDGTDTLFSFHESSHSSGDFYAKWEVTINEAADIQSIVGSIERVAVGAGAPADVPFGPLSKNGDGELVREADKRKGTFHQKIGSVTATTVDQRQFSNINWGATVLPEVTSTP